MSFYKYENLLKLYTLNCIFIIIIIKLEIINNIIISYIHNLAIDFMNYNTYWTITSVVPVFLHVLHKGVNLISVDVFLILIGATLFSSLVVDDWWVSSDCGPMSNCDDVVITPLALGMDLI